MPKIEQLDWSKLKPRTPETKSTHYELKLRTKKPKSKHKRV